MIEQVVRASIDAAGHQIVEIVVDRGYHPDTIIARADLPLRVVLRRQDADSCSERVVFSSPHIDRHLAPTGSTTIDLPAQPPGEVRFTCGMGRYRGRIELVPTWLESPSLIARVCRWAARFGGAASAS